MWRTIDIKYVGFISRQMSRLRIVKRELNQWPVCVYRDAILNSNF